jgi:hypothetical protein
LVDVSGLNRFSRMAVGGLVSAFGFCAARDVAFKSSAAVRRAERITHHGGRERDA